MFTDQNTTDAGVGTGSSNPAFTRAITGVLEVQGQVDCNALRYSGYEFFDVSTLTQEGSSWSQREDVLHAVTYYGDARGQTDEGNSSTQPAAPAPFCNYSTTLASDYITGDPLMELFWNPVGG